MSAAASAAATFSPAFDKTESAAEETPAAEVADNRVSIDYAPIVKRHREEAPGVSRGSISGRVSGDKLTFFSTRRDNSFVCVCLFNLSYVHAHAFTGTPMTEGVLLGIVAVITLGEHDVKYTFRDAPYVWFPFLIC